MSIDNLWQLFKNYCYQTSAENYSVQHEKPLLMFSLMSGAFSTIPAGGGDVNKDGQAVPCRSDAKNLTQVFFWHCINIILIILCGVCADYTA